MMQNLWQQKLGLKYSSDILDIIQFGSSIKSENPNDLDIAVIYNKMSVKEQLLESQKIKKQIQEKTKLSVHIHSFDLYSLFDESNFSKEGILFEGKSLISGDSFALHLGLLPKIQISYSLIELPKKDKIRFNYLLSGKGGEYSLLKKYGGKLIKPGLIEINPEDEQVFIKKMKQITDKITITKIFIII